MAYVKTEWVNGASGNTPISAANLNKIENQLEFLSNNTVVAVYSISTASGNKTVASSDFYEIDSNYTLSMTPTKGDTITIYLKIGGVWNSNNAYGVGFAVKMDGTTWADSGTRNISPADWATNWSTDGSTRVCDTLTFVFKNVTPGTHTFKFYWTSYVDSVTAYIGQYGSILITAIES